MNPLKIEISDQYVSVAGLSSSTDVWPIYTYQNARYCERMIVIKAMRNGIMDSVVVNLSGDTAEKIVRAYSYLGIE